MKYRMFSLVTILALCTTFVGFYAPMTVSAASCTTYTSSPIAPARFDAIAGAVVNFSANSGDSITATSPGNTIRILITSPAQTLATGNDSVSITAPVTSGNYRATAGLIPTDFTPFFGTENLLGWVHQIRPLIPTPIVTLTVVVCPPGVGGPRVLYDDGRLNNNDALETAAVYCTENGGLVIYGPPPPSSLWHIVLTVTTAELDSVPTHPDIDILIKSGGGVNLYRLTSGELQINAPGVDAKGDYVFIFKDCPRPDTTAF